ncbi:permease [Gudongella sp. DL1XJH-153]|uniref:permease n=1 Tax=Gudongella sp. DL1XJH-153 TaxID=3409804 RepID=UPI003BB6CF70
MIKLIIRYKWFLLAIMAVGAINIVDKDLGTRAIGTTMMTLKEMILIIPPIFVLLGLLDTWVPKDTMVKYMGEDSGIKGILLAFFIGSAAAGPLYGAFPVAAVFMKKGVKFSNILIFIGAWSTTKIPMFLFEISSLGAPFALTRLFVNIPGIIIIAHILNSLVSKDEVDEIYRMAERIAD